MRLQIEKKNQKELLPRITDTPACRQGRDFHGLTKKNKKSITKRVYEITDRKEKPERIIATDNRHRFPRIK
ncbi:MAG: hypothetical protein PHX21_08575 [bacterium]|nr:hypothetical protein [bacterium]